MPFWNVIEFDSWQSNQKIKPEVKFEPQHIYIWGSESSGFKTGKRLGGRKIGIVKYVLHSSN